MWNRRAAEQMKHVWTWNISHFSKFLWWVFCMINKSNVYKHKIENSEWRHWTFMRFFYINNSRCYTINRWSISRFKKIRETKPKMRLFLPRSKNFRDAFKTETHNVSTSLTGVQSFRVLYWILNYMGFCSNWYMFI